MEPFFLQKEESVNAREWLSTLMDSIHGTTQEEFFSAAEKVTEKQDGEIEIEKLAGFLGQFWAFAWNRQQSVRAQMMRMMLGSIEAGEEPPDEEKKRLEDQAREAEMVMDLFWFLARHELGGVSGTIGVRRGGLLVQVPEKPGDRDNGPDVVIHAIKLPFPPDGGILSKIFGGGEKQ